MADLDVESTVAIASAALGEVVRDGEPLGGSQRSLVLRARCADGRPVVVKRFAPEPDPDPGPDGYRREVLGLALLDRTPRLLARDDTARLLVMSDLGAHPTLADRLLATDGAAAQRAALEWATALGDLLGGSVVLVDRAVRELGLGGAHREPTQRRARAGLTALAETAGVAVSPAALAETETVAAELLTDDGLVVSPGDMCPDNALLTPTGARFVDLETTAVRPIAFDAAYVMLPFATCWCVYAQPAGLIDDMLEAFERAVAARAPGLLGTHWRQRTVVASVGWVLWMAPALLRHARDPGRRMGPAMSPALTTREHLLLRLDWVTRNAEPVLPAVAGLAAAVAASLRRTWGTRAPPVYPAWSGCC